MFARIRWDVHELLLVHAGNCLLKEAVDIGDVVVHDPLIVGAAEQQAAHRQVVADAPCLFNRQVGHLGILVLAKLLAKGHVKIVLGILFVVVEQFHEKVKAFAGSRIGAARTVAVGQHAQLVPHRRNHRAIFAHKVASSINALVADAVKLLKGQRCTAAIAIALGVLGYGPVKHRILRGLLGLLGFIGKDNRRRNSGQCDGAHKRPAIHCLHSSSLSPCVRM